MNYAEKHIVENYFGLFESLGNLCKLELVKKLTNSLKSESNDKELEFYKSFGAINIIKMTHRFGNAKTCYHVCNGIFS